MMREVRKGRIAAIVAYKLDRLGRSLAHLAQLIGEMTAHRVALVMPAQGIDTSTIPLPVGKRVSFPSASAARNCSVSQTI